MARIQEFLERLKGYDRLVNIAEIARRYFAMNAFDGVLTIIGVLMGNLIADVENPQIVVSTGLATCIAMGISGLWGAYLTESAERQRDIDELSQYTLEDINDSRIGRASRVAVVMVALVDGISPFLAAFIVLIPFFFADLFATITMVYYISLGTALLTLFALGLFLGHISRGNLFLFGIRTVVAGLISILISYLLGE
jgi:predicted membrane protein (TIGR00267 family)